ncbi:MAG: response regulator [Proteobacteria bacterium]|nr:MAG: response regulator [Pseudomonadota bacterium]
MEDNALLLEMLEEVLCFEGFHVLKANNGRSAFAMIDSETKIDIVISDVQMPGGDGIELMKKIHMLPSRRRPGLILTTGSASNLAETVSAYSLLGIFAKPVDYERMIETIRNHPVHETRKNLEEELVSF